MSKDRKQHEKGLHELYADDPLDADWLVWGRQADPITRRGFLKKSGLVAMTTALGAQIPFADKMPGGLIPAALAQTDRPFKIRGKHPGLIVLNDRPLNVETPPELMDDPVTPADRLFIRDNGIPPAVVDAKEWTLELSGESAKSTRKFTIDQLKEKFKTYTYRLTIECGGNGRSEFNPPAKGNQWSVGAVGCPEFTGVRVRDVLESVGIKDDAVYIGFYGADAHTSGDPKKVPISRGVPMSKALEDETLIAWAMNDEPIPLAHGHPLRLICGGWPGSTCGKWLTKIVIRNKVHDGPKMTGHSYRVPCNPVAPGAKVAESELCIIESMPVKSLITYPKTGAIMNFGESLEVRGHAWAGDDKVTALDVSIDFGATWRKCSLREPKNRLAWQQWESKLKLPDRGYYEVWARATDSQNKMQPMVVPGWNPKGYLNNACHRIAVKVV